jgi:putative transposase
MLHGRQDSFTQWTLSRNSIDHFASNCNKFGHGDYDAELSKLFNGYQIKRRNAKRGTLGFVIQNYSGYASRGYRNSLPRTPISFKNNSAVRFYCEDGKVDLNTSTFKLRFPFLSDYLVFPINVVNNADNLLPLIKSGANMRPVKGDKFLVTFATRQPFTHAYEPEAFLGFDINQFHENFVYCSDGEVFNLPWTVKDLLMQSKETWDTINDKSIKSSVRSYHRRRWLNLRKQIVNYLMDLSNVIADKAVKNNSIVCIDDVHVTGSYGFGNDLLIKSLCATFEQRGIPHILVHPSNTSRKCYECGYTSDTNRPNRLDKAQDYFLCLKCGHSNAIADHHAAINVLLKGKEMCMKKEPEFDEIRNLISEIVAYTKSLF